MKLPSGWVFIPVSDMGKIQIVQKELILCKDCKWGDWYTSISGERYCHCLVSEKSGLKDTDFCSFAEKEN